MMARLGQIHATLRKGYPLPVSFRYIPQPQQVVELFDGWFECRLGIGPLVEDDECSDEAAVGRYLL
jgi:hypothetical protein